MVESRTLSKRDERRALHQELSSNQILDAAEEVFAAKGFHDATIKEIAALAEFSVGAVYSFFENKDDLFVQIYLRRGAEFMGAMREVVDEGLPPREQLHRLADFQIDFFREHPNFGRLFLRASAVVLGDVETKIDQAVGERYAEAMRMQASMFETGQRDGTLRAGDPAVMAELFSGLVSSYQANDPVIMEGGTPGDEAMSVDDFHAVLDGAFGT